MTCHYCKGSRKNRVSYKEDTLRDYEEIDRKPIIKRGCFISTAVVTSLGKTDNCKELNTLRQFRDNYVRNRNERLVEIYYAVAPQIIKRIDGSANPNEQYQKLWADYVLICYQLISKNRNEVAFVKYQKMLLKLILKYDVKIDIFNSIINLPLYANGFY